MTPITIYAGGIHSGKTMALLKETLDIAFEKDLSIAIFATEGIRHALYDYLKDKDLLESDKKILISTTPVAELTDAHHSQLDEFFSEGGVLAIDDSMSEYDAVADFVRQYKDKVTHVVVTAGRQGLNTAPEHLKFPKQFESPDFELSKRACVKMHNDPQQYEIIHL